MTDLHAWREPHKDTIHLDDLVRIDSGRARYKVTRIVQTPSGSVEVHAYGGRPGFAHARVFKPEQVTRVRSDRNDNAPTLDALHEVAEASKRKRGRR